MSTPRGSETTGRHSDVVLVSMPFGPVFSPSLGLSLLKAGLTARQICATIRYFTIPFAEQIGEAFYSGIAEGKRPPLQMLAGEWIFARMACPNSPADDAAYVEDILGRGSEWARRTFSRAVTAACVRRLLDARDQVNAFLDRCLDQILADRPRIVGFTSVFQQHLASLALARRLKAVQPEIAVVFGGANCEGVMGAETVRQFPFVDAAVSGEGDVVFPELVRRLLAAESLDGLGGVRTPKGIGAELADGTFANAPMVSNLDDLPHPDFEDYFDQFAKSRFDRAWYPHLSFETSRGCWWGERRHCTFCGLNGGSMTFRSKSARRAVDELVSLTTRYPNSDVQVVDNILDPRYFKGALPELAARRLDVTLFYETKSNLKKDQVRLLAASGIRRIQPGIESFSDPVLELMRKGVSALQNIQLLKWCKELGVDPRWNFLWGFPGEPPEEYARMAQLVPHLVHLAPPGGISAIRLDRFSPNFFGAEHLGFTDITPLPSYRAVYSLSDAAVANLAYYFTFRYRQPQDAVRYVRPLVQALRSWKKMAAGSELFAVDTGADLLICDFRLGRPEGLPYGRNDVVRREPLTVLRGLDRTLYRLCDAASDLSQLARALEQQGAGPIPPEEIARQLDPYVSQGLMIRDGSRYLALAVPVGEYQPSRAAMKRFYRLLGSMGSRQPSPIAQPEELVVRQPVLTREGRS